MRHPQWPELTVAEVLQDEQARLMPLPRAFDGYVEQPVRVSATGLVHVQRNRYSVPTEYAHRVVSLRSVSVRTRRHRRGPRSRTPCAQLRARSDLLRLAPLHQPDREEARGAAQRRSLCHDARAAACGCRRTCCKYPGGDRVMAQVLAAVPVHGLEAVLVAAEIALESGRPSGEHVLNVLARLTSPAGPPSAEVSGCRRCALTEEPPADVIATSGCVPTRRQPMSIETVAQLKALKLHGMASSWPELVAQARHARVRSGAFRGAVARRRAGRTRGALDRLPDERGAFPGAPGSGRIRVRPVPRR